MFSKSCEYGIKATLYLAKHSLNSEDKVGVKDIAKEIESPEAFTAKILQILSRAKVVHSLKGPTGGFYIPKDKLKEIKLVDIVNAIDGDTIYEGCGLGLSDCNDETPCPVHNQFKIIKEKLKRMLVKTSLYELATDLDSGFTFLKR
ncbi:MAG: Rrf2 family transcriptional regulator [Brumimicrobium sp.]|nr:Rrf2 family transcriptional regulator [Brumimicrobium sp.]MCO5268026.1 Rrf2 family transcriptional regulator [Brumimicrobium sp.]